MPSTGNAQFKNFRIALRRAVFVDAFGATGKDDAFGGKFGDSLGGDVVPQNLAVHVLFANAASNQLRVLRTEIQHNDSLAG